MGDVVEARPIVVLILQVINMVNTIDFKGECTQ